MLSKYALTDKGWYHNYPHFTGKDTEAGELRNWQGLSRGRQGLYEAHRVWAERKLRVGYHCIGNAFFLKLSGDVGVAALFLTLF